MILKEAREDQQTRYPGGGVLRILSDRDDRTIFLGLKFSIFGIFLGRKILASIYLDSLILGGIFLGIQN